MNNHKKYVRERERERELLKEKKKKVKLARIVPRSLLVEAEEEGWRRSGGIRGGAGSSTSDDNEDDGNREGSGGDGSGDETRGGISKGASLCQIRDVIQVIFFYLLFFKECQIKFTLFKSRYIEAGL